MDRMTEQQLNWLQHQQPQNSVQMPCTSADMFSDGCLTNDWSHHLANDAANPEDAAFFRQFLTSASSWQGSLSTDVNLCSLKADNAAVLQPLASSDPAFVERAAKFSSFNGESLKSSADSSRAESDGGGRLVAVPEETSVVVVSDRHPTNGISRKRKIDRKASWDSDESTEKRGKKNEAPVKVEEASNNEISAESSPKVSKETSKTSTEPPKDYIHVRARRGQATDSHSLAERVRREKISERMRHLQDLVPGCNKVTGKAVMLDEIINYVKSLQRQVEFLSMKLAAVNPRLDFNIDRIFSKEMVGSIASSGNFTPGPLPTDLASFIHIQQYQQMQCNIRPDMVAAADTCSLHATTDSSPDIFADLSIPQGQVQGPWEAELHHVFTMPIQAKQPSFSCPSISGNLEGHQSKLDM